MMLVMTVCYKQVAPLGLMVLFYGFGVAGLLQTGRPAGAEGIIFMVLVLPVCCKQVAPLGEAVPGVKNPAECDRGWQIFPLMANGGFLVDASIETPLDLVKIGVN